MKKAWGIALAVLAAGAVSLSIGACGSEPDAPSQVLSSTPGSAAQDVGSAQDFAEQIKRVFAEKDLAKLADLCAYPVYVGLGA